ncbi:TetR/AcrR family transcriptional regulator [Psychromonas algicola]|uniref:TetR/AcrR family transcriptional regulator n=1 Tax=Psychromonas algicola TaxID=2555642 RepID=UPI0010683DF7|nr:TetR/AcrR family transcriptional regulator [Psychromonas sp. RZ5]TEW51518.1 TetR/AcrR family transcriptional regulator [Psychromonas sp. RZ5]
MKTRDKIASTALLLFNQKGERNITTNHIAAELGISPGNLYYHFKNKQEIIGEIFETYSVELIDSFAPVDLQEDILVQLKRYLDNVFTLMWKYRFFYANLPQILQQDQKLHENYLNLQQKSKVNLHRIFNTFIELNILDIEQQEIEPLVSTLQLIMFSWLSYQLSMSLNSAVTEKIVYQGVLQMVAVIRPYTTDLGDEQLNILVSSIEALD